jgi:hypothetical protein
MLFRNYDEKSVTSFFCSVIWNGVFKIKFLIKNYNPLSSRSFERIKIMQIKNVENIGKPSNIILKIICVRCTYRVTHVYLVH